ncbi:MAG: hypothetical protein ACRDN6_01405 [Gaiellaceae bacterium]
MRIVALTARRLKPGAYDDWRKAWEPDEWPEGIKAYVVRNLANPDEVIAFGFGDTDSDPRDNTDFAEQERRRQERMAPFIESVIADGTYEVLEEVGAEAAVS